MENLPQSVTYRYREFFGGIGNIWYRKRYRIDIRNIWYRKRYRIGIKKYLVPEKKVSVSEIFDTGKKNRYRLKF